MFQVWRYQPVRLGVTFEEQIQCNISKGLHYSWTLYGPTGLQLSITGIKTNQQHLELPGYLLHYGTYRAAAKVKLLFLSVNFFHRHEVQLYLSSILTAMLCYTVISCILLKCSAFKVVKTIEMSFWHDYLSTKVIFFSLLYKCTNVTHCFWFHKIGSVARNCLYYTIVSLLW